MKKTRRIAAMIAALAMAATMAAPFTMTASAADVNIKVQKNGEAANEVTHVTPDKDNAEHTYTAYQIFTGEYKLKQGKDEGSTNPEDYEFKVTGLGSDATTNNLISNAAFLAFKAADDKPTVGEAIGSATGAAAAKAAAQALDGILDGSPKAQELADILAAAITTGGTALTTDGKDFAEGYYLVKDSYTKAEDGSNDAISDFILRVNSKKDSAGITIIPKKSYPEVIKKVQENQKNVLTDWVNTTATALESNVETSDKWNDVADYNIGDAVPFQLYGSLPETLADYGAYYYLFTDTLGTQFDQPQAVTVGIGNKKTLTFTLNNNVYTLPENDQLEWNYASDDDTKTVKVPNTDGNARVTWDSATHKLLVSFEDIKEYGVVPTDIITVNYTAVLNDTAVIGLNGQENKVDLTYTNNPNFTYSPETDTPNTPDIPTIPDKPDDFPETPDIPEETPDTPEKPNTPDSPDVPTDNTPEDRVVVFTYEIDINKIDGDTNKPLEGAKFKLSNGTKWATVDANGKLTGWADSEDGGTELESDADGLFKIIGLDSGSYTLTETEAPEGYNLPANPNFDIVLNAMTENTQKYTSEAYPAAAAVLTGIDGRIAGEAMNPLEADAGANRGERGGIEGTIKNNKGTALPSTGGMGTILFYTVGGIMVVGAGVVLVTKKRSKNEQ